MSIIQDQSSEVAGSTAATSRVLLDEKERTSSTTGASNTVSEEEGDWKDIQSKEKDAGGEEDDWTFPDGGVKAWSVVFVGPADGLNSHSLREKRRNLRRTILIQGCFMLAGAGMGYSLIWGSWLQVSTFPKQCTREMSENL